MPVAAVAAVVGAVAVVGGTAMQVAQASKMRKAQKRQYAYERQLQQNRAAKERRDAIRTGRLAAATVAQGAENTGGSLSSAALGGLGSIQSQINANLSFLDTNQKLSDAAGLQASKANSAASHMQSWGAITALGQQIFSAAGGTGAFKKGS